MKRTQRRRERGQQRGSKLSLQGALDVNPALIQTDQAHAALQQLRCSSGKHVGLRVSLLTMWALGKVYRPALSLCLSTCKMEMLQVHTLQDDPGDYMRGSVGIKGLCT